MHTGQSTRREVYARMDDSPRSTHRIGLACDARRSDRRLPIVPSPTPTNPIERCEQRMRSLMRQCERERERAAALRASIGFRRTRAARFA
jgi:hypothetical protein